MPKKNVWIHQIKPKRVTKIVVTGKNREIQNFARASAAVLSGCLFWLLLPAPQHLYLDVLQVGQCLEPTNDPGEKTTLIGLVVPSRQLFKIGSSFHVILRVIFKICRRVAGVRIPLFLRDSAANWMADYG
jgi:hypothetical protein